MKFQLKALVAALALVAVLPAQAAIDSPTTGSSSLVLSVWDAANNVSATFDLGFNYSEFNVAGSSFADSGVTNPGTSYAWDLTANVLNNGRQGDYATAWSTFASIATEANASWAITTADNLGNTVGARGFITTYTGAPLAFLSSSNMVTALGNFKTYTDATSTLSTTFENHSTALNGASVNKAGTSGYFTPYYTGDRNNNVGPIAAGLINSSLSVIQVTNNASAGSAVTNTIFGNQAQFTLTSAGQLNYTTALAAPIPEADTWAMMLLGLGFMGFVARRKQA